MIRLSVFVVAAYLPASYLFLFLVLLPFIHLAFLMLGPCTRP